MIPPQVVYHRVVWCCGWRYGVESGKLVVLVVRVVYSGTGGPVGSSSVVDLGVTAENE